MRATQRPPVTQARSSHGGGIAPFEHRATGMTGESALALAALRTGMSEEEVLDLAVARSAWRAAVVVQLGAGGVRPEWSRTPLPAIMNLESLHHAAAFAGVDRHRLLRNDSTPTALETADGNWGPAIRRLAVATARPDTTIDRLAEAFDHHLAPSCMRPRTRADYWRAWRLVVTWAVARRAVTSILPMSLATLKALTWDLVCFAVPTSQIEAVWKAVQARHRQFHLRPPLTEIGQFARWSRMLGMIRGRPAALKLPIQKATVRWLLAWRPASLAAHRARLLTIVATLACLRVSEVARLQCKSATSGSTTSLRTACPASRARARCTSGAVLLCSAKFTVTDLLA